MTSATEDSPPPQAASSTTTSQNYYEILGITPEATDEEIKRAYRKLALRLHPDKNPDPDAPAQFQAVDKAYKVLSDPKLRSTYDQLGPRAADAMRRMNDEYAEAWGRMAKWKKILLGIICFGTGCCFGCGCCCLCGCVCCCNFCCGHCCGKYKHTEETFTSFPDDDDLPGLHTYRNANQNVTNTTPKGPQETDPVLGTNTSEKTAIPMPPSYESTVITEQPGS